MAPTTPGSKLAFGVSLAALPWASAVEGAVYAYGPYTMRPALHYFRHWSDDAISQLLEQHGTLPYDERFVHEPPTSAGAVNFLVRQHESTLCASPLTNAVELHSSELDERGVHHAVVKTVSGRLQYVASKNGRVLLMDPAACALPSVASPVQDLAMRRLSLFADGDDDQLLHRPELGHANSSVGGKEELLHPKQDELVKDCAEAFERTAKDHCKENLKIEVLTASLMIVDGIEVRLHAKISHGKREPTIHRVRCAFEPTSKKDAMKGVHDPKEALPEEKDGLHATVLMHLDICKSDDVDGVDDNLKKTLKLFEMHPTGELSLLKGYQHVYDRVPEWVSEVQIKAEDLPNDYDLREVVPVCFPGEEGSEVVQNQGTCGSCWAFASATALMTNICVKGQGAYSLETRKDRYEVSVQRILSCNKYKYGCEGGHALAAADSFEHVLAAMERSVPYMCGGGDALKHFEVESSKCDAFPWGGSDTACEKAKAKSEWQFRKLFTVSGEAEMKKAIVGGNALFTGMRVYENFFHPPDGVYITTEGKVLGAHAVVLVGYGALGNDPYWVLQNSWGPDWHDNGFVKFGRGRNLADIESKAIYFDGEPLNGGTLPPEIKETPIERLTTWALWVKKRAKKQPKAVLIGAAVGAGVVNLAFIALCVRCACRSSGYDRLSDKVEPEQA